MNPPAEKLLGVDAEDMVGEFVEMLVPEKKRWGHQAYRRGYFAEPRKREMDPGLYPEAERPDGTLVPVSGMLEPVRGDGVLYAAVHLTESARTRTRRRGSSRVLVPGQLEAVSDSSDGRDESRRPSVRLEVGAQALDVHVEGLRVADVVGTPDPVDERVAGEHPPGVLDEKQEQVELLAPQLHILAADHDLAAVGVHP